MKRVKQVALGTFAAVTFAFAASANAQPGEGGRMGHGVTGEQHGQGRHAGMQAQMAQRMSQHQSGHARGQGSSAGGCAMGQQGGSQAEHKH